MSRRHDVQDATGRIEYLSGRGTLEAWGTGAPTNSVAGFAPGCIYHRGDGAAGTALYLNEGTFSSSTWVPVGSGVGVFTTATITTATITTANITTLNPTNIVRASQRYQVGRGVAKVGGTSGWVVNAANDLGSMATMAASQSAGTLVVGLPGLHVGDTITGFVVVASINSAGNTVTLDANLRTNTVAAGATGTDASVATMTQVSVTAATASTSTKTGLSTVIATGVNYYLLITGTTGSTTTIELDQIEVVVTTA